MSETHDLHLLWKLARVVVRRLPQEVRERIVDDLIKELAEAKTRAANTRYYAEVRDLEALLKIVSN